MINVRIGLNIREDITIKRNGSPEDFTNVSDLNVVVQSIKFPMILKEFTNTSIKVNANKL